MNQGFEWELGLFGTLRVLYRVYHDPLVILTGIRDLNKNSVSTLLGSPRVLYKGCEQLVLSVGIMEFGLLGISGVLFRIYQQLVF